MNDLATNPWYLLAWPIVSAIVGAIAGAFVTNRQSATMPHGAQLHPTTTVVVPAPTLETPKASSGRPTSSSAKDDDDVWLWIIGGLVVMGVSGVLMARHRDVIVSTLAVLGGLGVGALGVAGRRLRLRFPPGFAPGRLFEATAVWSLGLIAFSAVGFYRPFFGEDQFAQREDVLDNSANFDAILFFATQFLGALLLAALSLLALVAGVGVLAYVRSAANPHQHRVAYWLHQRLNHLWNPGWRLPVILTVIGLAAAIYTHGALSHFDAPEQPSQTTSTSIEELPAGAA